MGLKGSPPSGYSYNEITGKFDVDSGALTGVPPTRQVIAGQGLTGGGALSANVTLNVGSGTGITVGSNDISLAASGVTAGSYTNTDLTVDTYGRITAASNGSGGSGTTSLMTKAYVAAGDTTTVTDRYQIVVCDEFEIEATGTLDLESGATLCIL